MVSLNNRRQYIQLLKNADNRKKYANAINTTSQYTGIVMTCVSLDIRKDTFI